MSGVKTTLRDVLTGGDPDRAVLHNCALEGAGVSLYGREAILEFFRAAARRPDYVRIIEARRGAALFATGTEGSMALFADLHEGKIMRLRYLASRSSSQRSIERIDVPCDPGFGQLLPQTALEPADHPELNPTHLRRVTAWAARLVREGPAGDTPLPALAGLSRARAHAVRAFSQGDCAAVLAILAGHRADGRPGLVTFAVAENLTSDQPADQGLVVDEGERVAQFARVWRPAF